MTVLRAIRTTRAHDRRLVRRVGRRGGRRAGAAVARLRYQRLDPRAVLVLRPVRPEADLRPAVARAHVSVRRQPRPSRAAGAHRAAIWRSPTMRCRATIRTTRLHASGRSEPVLPKLERASTGLRIAMAGGYFGAALRPGAGRPRARRQGAGATARSRFPRPRGPAPQPIVITATEGAALHLDRLRTRAPISIRPCATG